MVKYAPRKVYIRESGGYVELSYTEFCRCRESDQTYMDKLFIPIQGCLLEVVREQYTDFYRDKERWRYLQKLDTKNRLLSLDGFTDSEGNPLDFITDEAVDIAETVVNAVMVDRLKAALPLLSDSEQELIQAIFFDGLSEREVGARLGITQSVVNKRKARILIKLRKIIENSNFSLSPKKYIITEVILHQKFKNAEHYAPHPHYTYINSFNTISSAEPLTLFISPTHFIWSVAFNSSVIPVPAFICSTRSSNLS